MDISLTSWHTPAWGKLLLFFVLLWPFLTLAVLPRRTTSAAVTAAALAPIALALAGSWLGFAQVMEGLSRSGGGIGSASARVAETMMAVGLGFFCAVAVLVLAAFKRHWPAADRVTLILTVAIVALSLAVALALIAWFALVSRGRVVSQPLRFAIVPLLLVVLAIFVVARQQAIHYADIARGGWIRR